MLPVQSHRFSLPRDLHYLNCAYMSPLPNRVQEIGVEAVRRKGNPAAIATADFFDEGEKLRRLFGRLVNAPDPGRIAIIPAVSYGMAVVSRNLRLSRGQNVVVAHEQFPSNVYAWRRQAAAEGVELRVVAPDAGNPSRGRSWNERMLEAIDARTGLVALGHVHWTDGTLFDLEAIGGRTREVGAAFVVDGTQSVGALPFDLQRVRPDALICAGYKWLLGPYSIGVAWFGPRFDSGVPLEETWIGRAGSDDFSALVNYRDEYQPGARRYDVGERSNFILVPMLNAGLELLLELQVPAIQAYCAALTRGFFEQARGLGFQAEEERWRAAHLFGIRAPAHVDLDRVARALQERRVAVSRRGTAIRISPHVYNTPDDLDALIGALRAGVEAPAMGASTVSSLRLPRRSP